MPCRPLLVLVLALVIGEARAQAPVLSDDNEFSTQTPAEFMTVPPDRDFDAQGLIAARAVFTAALQLDNVLTPGPNYPALSNLFGEAEIRGYVAFTRLFTVNGLFRLDQGRDQLHGGAFVDQTLYVQRLFGVINLFDFNTARLSVYGGKIHPRFGIGWFFTPGLYGADFAEEYELNERLGAGVRFDFRALARHRVTFEAFQADTSFLIGNFLAHSVQPGDPGSKRQVTRSLADGGVSNTGNLDSFSLVVTSRRFPGLPGLGTEIGFASQRASALDTRDEKSLAVSAHWLLPLREGVSIEPMAEFASVAGQGGTERYVDYLTSAANLRIADVWAIGAHMTQKFVRDFAQNDFRTDWLAGLSLACDLGEAFKGQAPWLAGVTAVAGYRYDRRSGVARDTLGFLLKYERVF